jgi:ankyrin repeat protein
MLTFALVRNRVVRGIALVLAIAPPLIIGARYVGGALTSPSAEALNAGHGYFTRPADRALADAVVAGDGRKVAELAPAANTNAIGFNDMTFMSLALNEGRADPDVVAALLRAGADPDQDNQMLFGFMTESDAVYGMMIKDKNERLLRAVIDAGIDLNHENRENLPRFFSALKWPEGLALMLEHGANPEAEDKDGATAITWAVKLRYWPAIDVLLAHGARIDHVAHDGKGLRDAVREELARYQQDRRDAPPQLLALAERLH